MFTVVQPLLMTAFEDPVPEWSGMFIEVNRGMGIMRVHVSDTRQHFPPEGWRAIGHDTHPDGTLEVYVYFKVSAE